MNVSLLPLCSWCHLTVGKGRGGGFFLVQCSDSQWFCPPNLVLYVSVCCSSLLVVTNLLIESSVYALTLMVSLTSSHSSNINRWMRIFLSTGVPAHSRVSTKIQQLLNTLKRPKRPPLSEFFQDDSEEIVEGMKLFLVPYYIYLDIFIIYGKCFYFASKFFYNLIQQFLLQIISEYNFYKFL